MSPTRKPKADPGPEDELAPGSVGPVITGQLDDGAASAPSFGLGRSSLAPMGALFHVRPEAGGGDSLEAELRRIAQP